MRVVLVVLALGVVDCSDAATPADFPVADLAQVRDAASTADLVPSPPDFSRPDMVGCGFISHTCCATALCYDGDCVAGVCIHCGAGSEPCCAPPSPRPPCMLGSCLGQDGGGVGYCN